MTLGPALLGRGALIDLDILSRVQPFLAIDGRSTEGFITIRGDTIDYYLPGIAAIKQAFFAGDFPTWAPYEVGGVPLASLPNHAALSPLSLPYFLLPLWLAPAFVKLGEFAVGIGGMVAFLGRHGVSRGSGVLAGILFVSSGFMMMWTNWPHTRVGALIPLLFWALERLIQERRSRDAVVVAAVVASMLLGGFPAVTAFSLTLAGVYVLVRVWSLFGSDLRAVAGVLCRAAGGVMLGVGLAAVQILPFLRYLDQLGLEERDYAGLHMPLALFITTVAPDAVGLSVNGTPRYGPVNPIEGVGFLGAVALVLAVTAVVLRVPGGTTPDRSPRRFLAVAAAVVVVAIWVGGPVLSGLQLLPFYSTNSIGRASSVFGFLGAALAGIGFDRLLRWVAIRRESGPDDGPAGEARRRWTRVAQILLPTAVLLGVTLFGIRVVDAAYDYAAADGMTVYLRETLLVPSMLLVAAVVAVLLIRFGPRPPWLRPARAVVAVAVAVLAVGQSAAFAHTMLPLSDPANLYPMTPTHAFLKAHIGEDRYASGDGTMYPATSDYYELRTPVGHEFTDPRWKDLLLATDPRVAITRTYSKFSSDVSPVDAGSSALLDQFAVRYWVAAPEHVVGPADKSPKGQRRVRVGPDERATCEIRGGAMRGIQVDVARSRHVPPRGRPMLHVAVHTPTGVIEGERLLAGEMGSGPQRVAVAGEGLSPGGRYPTEIWFTGLRGGTRLYGTGTQPGCAAVRPRDDGLSLVFAEAGATVYERLHALPRIRWASRSEVVEDADERVELLTRGIADDEVLLEDADAPAAEGGRAQLSTLSDEAEKIAVRVDAAGAGYLVVADALVRDGWTATVDGKQADLVHGNHAMAAVRVPAGEHRVELAYHAPGLRAGAAVSATSAVVACALLLVPVLRRRQRDDRWPAG